MSDLNGQIDSLSGLKKDWDSYNADPPTPEVIEAVRKAVEQLGFFPPDHICASAEGGAALCWFGPHDKYADIEFYNDGDIMACTSLGSGKTEDIDVWEPGDAIQAARKIQEFLARP